MRFFKSLSILSSLFLASSVLGENSVTFKAKGSPGFLTIEGVGGKVVGQAVADKDGKVNGVFEVDLRKFDTGIQARNEHMASEKYFNFKKYPKATLILDSTIIPKEGYFTWSGQLTLHGITKPVQGTAHIEKSQVKAEFTIDITQYEVEKPSYLGVGVNEKVAFVVLYDLDIKQQK